MTTVEIKYGTYVIVWIAFLYRFPSIAFSSSAKIMGIGNDTARLYKEIISVFFMMIGNLYEVKNLTKLSSPTHALPQIPCLTLYFLNAITSPPMGTYANTAM